MSDFTVIVVQDDTQIETTKENITVQVTPEADTAIEIETQSAEVTVVESTAQVDIVQDSSFEIELIEDAACCDVSNAVLYNIPCDATVYVGAAVILDASGTAFNALADDISTSNVLGVVENKTGILSCDVRVSGITENIYTGLDVTKEYYLSDTIAGGLQTTVPTDSGHVKIKLGQPASATRFFFIKGEPLIRV
jgi:hypothetical protein